ncbi:stAR-related lipid transfer protein 6 [Physeter macrocephalus]|uniref:StAR-related lipid transfer protein 6 n=1 Tax=Physeter macrocephalus TaxID=9755 RepID=A0A2Y9TAZ8_PHYMC|nr:stAR-related lipid transfer protein 6 [Physeter catodon]|eukprot:XP_023988071.2 stAR-related lipid transfer protein 6 [Physeter catodon]
MARPSQLCPFFTPLTNDFNFSQETPPPGIPAPTPPPQSQTQASHKPFIRQQERADSFAEVTASKAQDPASPPASIADSASRSKSGTLIPPPPSGDSPPLPSGRQRMGRLSKIHALFRPNSPTKARKERKAHTSSTLHPKPWPATRRETPQSTQTRTPPGLRLRQLAGKNGSDPARIGDPVRQPRNGEIIQTDVKTHLTTSVNLSTRLGRDMRCEESSFNRVVYQKKMPAQCWFVFYFSLTLWVKISLTVTPSEYVPVHPTLHHQKKITVSSKASKKFHGNLYRVEGIIPESTSKLSDFLYKPENRVTWDKLLKVYNMVQKIDSLLGWIFQHILHLQIISVVVTMLVAIYVDLCKRTQHIPN